MATDNPQVHKKLQKCNTRENGVLGHLLMTFERCDGVAKSKAGQVVTAGSIARAVIAREQPGSPAAHPLICSSGVRKPTARFAKRAK